MSPSKQKLGKTINSIGKINGWPHKSEKRFNSVDLLIEQYQYFHKQRFEYKGVINQRIHSKKF